jgi:hypothetical protein
MKHKKTPQNEFVAFFENEKRRKEINFSLKFSFFLCVPLRLCAKIGNILEKVAYQLNE